MVTPTSRQSGRASPWAYIERPGETLLPKCARLLAELRIRVEAERRPVSSVSFISFIERSQPADE